MSDSIASFLKQLFFRTFGSGNASLQSVQEQYKEQLMDRRFEYTFSEAGKKPFKACLEFRPSHFCHLFSVDSIAAKSGMDKAPFSGREGWNNIEKKAITTRLLKQMNPSEYAFYAREYEMMPALVQLVKSPRAVLYDPKKNPDSRLEGKIILYSLEKQEVLHLVLDRDEKGEYFPRSFFVRTVEQKKNYPSKYIAKMSPLNVKTKVSSKKA